MSLSLGVYTYSTTMGDTYGWRLVELLEWSPKYAETLQPVKQLATMYGFGSREDAIWSFTNMCDALETPEDVHDIVDVPRYGWAPRVTKLCT